MANATTPPVVTINELTPRTVPSEYYIPSRLVDVDETLKANGCDKQQSDKMLEVVADVINLTSGGEMTPIDNDLPYAEKKAEEDMVNRPKKSGGDPYAYAFTRKRLNESGEYTTTQNRENLKTSFVANHLAHSKFLRDVVSGYNEKYSFTELPGDSPLQRAVTFARMLAKANALESNSQSSSQSAEDIVDKVHNISDMLNDMSGAEQDLLDNKGEPTEEEGDKGGEGGGGLTRELRKAKMAEDMMEGKDKILKVARHLRTLSKMQIGRSHERRVDPAGRLLDPRTIDDYSNIAKVSVVEWSYPAAYRNYRVVTNQARIYERVRDVAKKQCIYMLVDCSGSMHGDKTFIAGGCIMRALKGVMDDDAEAYIRLFDTDLHEEHTVKTPKDAKKTMHFILNNNFSGGGTSITPCVVQTIKRIEELQIENSLTRPELVLVTDGDDDIRGLTLDSLRGIKLHAICIHAGLTSGAHMHSLAQQSGGISIHITKGMF
jgi:uncharacterized protein with von Willebrand factor type A (vWA) domain